MLTFRPWRAERQRYAGQFALQIQWRFDFASCTTKVCVVQVKLKHSTAEKPSSALRKQVFIVEDHPVVRQGLVQVVNREKDLTVCGQAAEADQALEAINRLKPDVVLVDISLPGKTGLELIKELRATDLQAKVLVVSMHDEALYADRVL